MAERWVEPMKAMQKYEDEALRELEARPQQEQAKLVQCRWASSLYISCPFGQGLSSHPCDHCVRPEAFRDRDIANEGDGVDV